MKSLSLIFVALALMLLSPRSAVAAGPPVQPCSLLTRQQAEMLFGGPLDHPMGMTVGCSFFGPHKDDQKGILVTLLMGAAMDGVANMGSIYNSMLRDDPNASIEPVSGVGEQANFATSKDGTIGLMVLCNGNEVGLGETASPNPRIKVDLIQTMRQNLLKL